tara:strand:- start:2046 stop:2684 length:639 start_codon:yes stop_codon:yes gene_type:complete
MVHRSALLKIYQRLYDCYGPQYWWPADSSFEVMVGAILTQNTSWKNVEKAINNLKDANALNVHTLIELPEENLAKLIRPSGYFNIKSKRLKNFAHWFEMEGQFNELNKLDTQVLRNRLIGVNGIGPETADDILLYAFERPIFVIDSYTYRLLKAFNLVSGDETYEILRQFFETALKPDVNLFKEYHALIVRHAKEKCTQEKSCLHCIIESPL